MLYHEQQNQTKTISLMRLVPINQSLWNGYQNSLPYLPNPEVLTHVYPYIWIYDEPLPSQEQYLFLYFPKLKGKTRMQSHDEK